MPPRLKNKTKNHAVTHTLFKVYTELILCKEVGIPVFCQVDSLQYAFMKIPPLCRVLTQLRMQRKILIKHEILALANFSAQLFSKKTFNTVIMAPQTCVLVYILALWASWHMEICICGWFIKGILRGYFGIRTLWNWDITTGGIFQLCELSDMGKLKHRDVSAQRYFGSVKVLVQEH